jgi:N-carbamoylputrescine amidase
VRSKVAALQLAFSDDVQENIASVSELVARPRQGREADPSARIIRRPLFLPDAGRRPFRPALPADQHPVVQAMQKLAAELQVYIPTSFFEAEGHHHYNSLAMIDDKGTVMGVYRKSHIPDGPGYSEKFYFRPGNTGFKTFRHRSARSAPPSAGINGIRKRRAR